MTQKEKAEAYDLALERTRKLYNSEETSADVEIACETIFPELAESEDERIRKEIIEYIKGRKITPNHPIADEWISWLEKQEEKKPAEWNDSDEERFQHSLLAIKTSQFYTEEDRYELVDWLKSLKQRMEEQL